MSISPATITDPVIRISDPRNTARPEDVFSKRASFYAISKVHDDKETLSWLVELASPQKNDRVLDVGTGAGHTAMALAPLVRHVDAVDLTKEMMEEARKLSEQRGLANISYHLGDAMSLPFPNASFDIVTCRRAAHHFTNVGRAIGEMARVLRPGGRLVIDDRSIPEDDEVDRTINALDVLHDPSHVRDYREGEWRRLVRDAGLEIAAVRLYRKRLPMAHFTTMVDKTTARRMEELVSGMSEELRQKVGFEVGEQGPVLDNYFILIAAVKPSSGISRSEPK